MIQNHSKDFTTKIESDQSFQTHIFLKQKMLSKHQRLFDLQLIKQYQSKLMGSEHSHKADKIDKIKVKDAAPLPDALNLKKYNKISVIGRGGFGKVWKIESKKNKKTYALKQMSKARVLFKKSVESVMNELNLLKCLKDQFLINALYAFQDRQNLYLIMDLISGGDLRFHLIKNGTFSEEQSSYCFSKVEFFAASIILGLQFLHNKGIIHRDLKPENLVFDKKGYIHLTDLGVARIWKPQNACDTSGTPGYMAPQVMCRCNHGVAVDYYALGIIMFECIFGIRPYIGSNRQQIRDKILAKQVQIKKKDIPHGWSFEAIDFVNHLIQRKPQNRLGNNGPDQVMNHPWFKDLDWQRLRRKQFPAPFAPLYNPDQYQQQLNNVQEVVIPSETVLLLKKQAIQNLFIEYFYDGKVVQNPLLQV